MGMKVGKWDWKCGESKLALTVTTRERGTVRVCDNGRTAAAQDLETCSRQDCAQHEVVVPRWEGTEGPVSRAGDWCGMATISHWIASSKVNPGGYLF